jgi:uncharacterized membrane protein YgdD (TMEM256/DUF423 family)
MGLEKFCLTGAGFSGLLAVGLGAFGAHGLKAQVASLPPEEAAKILGWVETGAKYQLVHAAALLALAALAPRLAPAPAKLAARGLFWGSLLFSATLYAMALGGPRWLGAVTPLGGLGMLAGWGALLWAGTR